MVVVRRVDLQDLAAIYATLAEEAEVERLAEVQRLADEMGIELLRPPLYWKDPSGNRQRIWTPTTPRRADLRVEIFTRDGFTCQECGKVFDRPDNYSGVRTIPGLSLGHIIDYRDGGPYVAANLRAECVPCNDALKHKDPKGTPSRPRELVGMGSLVGRRHEPTS